MKAGDINIDELDLELIELDEQIIKCDKKIKEIEATKRIKNLLIELL